MGDKLSRHAMRWRFLLHLLKGLRVVWPILTALIGLMVALGCAIAWIENWSLFEGVYFAFVSGLTIGYGDLVPKTALARTLAVTIGFTGVVLTGIVAALAVHALNATHQAQHDK